MPTISPMQPLRRAISARQPLTERYGFGRTSPRFSEEDARSPGPGAYLTCPTPPKPAVAGPRTSPRQASAPRLSDWGKSDTPGPGCYDIPTTLQGAAPDGRSTQGAGGVSFAYTSPRFGDDRTETPGPGAYTPAHHTIQASVGPPQGYGCARRRRGRASTVGPRLSKAVSTGSLPLDRPVFGASSPRFADNRTDVPGPASYALPSTFRLRMPSRRTGAASEVRPSPRLPDWGRRSETPGPGAYVVPGMQPHPTFNTAMTSNLKAGAGFGGCSPRFGTGATDSPGPGAYNVRERTIEQEVTGALERTTVLARVPTSASPNRAAGTKG